MYLELEKLVRKKYDDRNTGLENAISEEYRKRLKDVGYAIDETNKDKIGIVIECFSILSAHIISCNDQERYKAYLKQFQKMDNGRYCIVKTGREMPEDFSLLPSPPNLPPPKKGLLLYGNAGTGKSFLLKTLSAKGEGRAKPVYYESAWNITKQYMKSKPDSAGEKVGYDFLDKFFNENRYQHIVIDDIGASGSAKRFGNTDITPMIFMERYENFLADQLTFFTSNLGTTEELKKEYGDRAFSRLSEMCFFIPFTGKDNRILN